MAANSSSTLRSVECVHSVAMIYDVSVNHREDERLLLLSANSNALKSTISDTIEESEGFVNALKNAVVVSVKGGSRRRRE